MFRSRIVSFINRLHSSNFLRDVSLLATGSIVSQIIGFISLPFLSRIYSPADYGLLALFMAVSSVIATIATLRYESSILIPKDDRDARAITVLCYMLIVIICSSLFLLTIFLPQWVTLHIGVAGLGDWFPLVSLGGATIACVSVGFACMSRDKSFFRMMIAQVVQYVVMAFMGIWLGYIGIKNGLLFSCIISQLIGASLIFYFVFKSLPGWKIVILRRVAKEHSAAPRYLLQAALLDTMTQQLPIFLITSWFSSTYAGQFNMAWRVSAIPIGLVGWAVGQVFFQRFSDAWPDKEAAQRILFNTWKLLIIIGIIPMTLILCYGDFIFSLVLGKEWAMAGRMASVMAPMVFAMLISSPTSNAFIVLGLQKYTVYFGISFLFYRIISIYVGKVIGDIRWGLACWALFEILAIYIYNVITIRRMRYI